MPKNTSTLWWLAGLLIVIVIIGWLYSNRASTSTTPSSPPTTSANSSTLPGIQTSQAPWGANQSDLAQRLAADNLPQLTMEGSVLHIHQHLDLIIGGQPVAVPAEIGINEPAGWLSPIHVHDSTGIIHVESPYVANFTLGNFFDVWGVDFASSTIGGYKTDATHSLRVYVNGQLYAGDPRMLTLASHQEIVIVYGTEAQMPSSIPASFNFPAGY